MTIINVFLIEKPHEHVVVLSRAVNSKSSVGISSVTGVPVHGEDPTEPIIKESARRPVTEKLPTELF